MFISGLMAVTLGATPAIDVEAMKAGRLPPTGTVEEADTCEMVSRLNLLWELLAISPDLKPVDEAKRPTITEAGLQQRFRMEEWRARSAGFHGAEQATELPADVEKSLMAIDKATYEVLEVECNMRLAIGQARTWVGLPFAAKASEVTRVKVRYDLAALDAGQLPAAGTQDEADNCAAILTFPPPETPPSQFTEWAGEWARRAAASRGMDMIAYRQDRGFVEAVAAISPVALKLRQPFLIVHPVVYTCANRLKSAKQ